MLKTLGIGVICLFLSKIEACMKWNPPTNHHFVNVYITIGRYDVKRTVTHMLPSLHRIYATPYGNLHKFQKPISI